MHNYIIDVKVWNDFLQSNIQFKDILIDMARIIAVRNNYDLNEVFDMLVEKYRYPLLWEEKEAIIGILWLCHEKGEEIKNKWINL